MLVKVKENIVTRISSYKLFRDKNDLYILCFRINSESTWLSQKVSLISDVKCFAPIKKYFITNYYGLFHFNFKKISQVSKVSLQSKVQIKEIWAHLLKGCHRTRKCWFLAYVYIFSSLFWLDSKSDHSRFPIFIFNIGKNLSILENVPFSEPTPAQL